MKKRSWVWYPLVFISLKIDALNEQKCNFVIRQHKLLMANSPSSADTEIPYLTVLPI